jgi:hypothetical protein
VIAVIGKAALPLIRTDDTDANRKIGEAEDRDIGKQEGLPRIHAMNADRRGLRTEAAQAAGNSRSLKI